MQKLEPILIFITVAEMGSFTRAADSLGIQKGRASTAVRKLEEAVGARLLHRTTRSVQLTEDGRVFPVLCSTRHKNLRAARPRFPAWKTNTS
jgi:DNA-binding transcriptional LysR family regulator